jgi:hypothetical protein
MAKNDRTPKTAAGRTRATVLHSGLAGMAAGVVAAAVSSPAGALAIDSIGQAVGVGLSINGSASPQEEARALIAPFTSLELSQIRARLADSAQAIESSRAATEPEIEFMRGVAARPGLRVHRRPAGV